ncbi:MAG: hypothetical protein GEU26_17290 [Nitrososphaeraceae archaeon]|nr:hypothetical protein [Nitrososphaeraceae archaeon]
MKEDKFRRLIFGFFVTKGNLTYVTHGKLENGADLILMLQQSDDILRRGQYFYFQAKTGKIKLLPGEMSFIHS